ncbi:Protein of unknown function [Acinetobacter marinus]|uniref:DUF3325 domain-containing protein n=1 Tax=Acinetobacter marinus TaxID=281375 RepID=A0A1G6JKA7_9GAMM|nr:DUF3325 domain-containing protein [Acinetobacter marinus]SDC18386.1 Protein of unknown function [Acinetobacter marinus]
MNDAVLMVLSTLILIFLGMLCLSYSMEKHYKSVFSRPFSTPKLILFRVLGWSLLLLSMYCCINIWNLPIGLAAWFGLLTFIVALLIYIQAYQASWTRYLAVVLAGILICLQGILLF